MRRLFGWLFFLALVGVAVYLLWPVVRNAQRLGQLLNAAAPAVGSLPNPLPGAALVDSWGKSFVWQVKDKTLYLYNLGIMARSGASVVTA